MSKSVGGRTDEVFVGNIRADEGVPQHLSGLNTVRIGEQALDIDGNKIDPSQMLPMFVGRSEIDAHHRIMMRRTFPNASI